MGGLATKKKKGKEFYAEIGKKGRESQANAKKEADTKAK